MIRLLMYGGCHALVMRDLIAMHCADRITASLLVNFELIRTGRPFPYEDLEDFDVVAFSPIENKGEYNTTHLVASCRAKGIQAICFPWLEWHGYCPAATKGLFKGRFQWRYNGLAEMADAFDDFESFHDHVVEAYPDDATIASTIARSTELLAASEDRNDMVVRVSDFIRERHRTERLFLISDHPSLSVYAHVIEQILALIGIPHEGLGARLAAHTEEPQWRWRTPIFPRVAEAMGLEFIDPLWIDDEMIPGRVLDLRHYLRLYYHRDSVILGPTSEAPVVVGGDPHRRIDSATRLVADRIRSVERTDEYRLIDVLSGGPLPIRRDDIFSIHADQWRSEWSF